MNTTPLNEHPFTPEEDARISAHIRARGLTFEVFLPEDMAEWLWQKLEAGVYTDPAEAAFLAFQDLMELDQHPKVRAELLKAILNAAADDPRPGISIDEWRARHDAKLREYASTEPPAPRTWPLATPVQPDMSAIDCVAAADEGSCNREEMNERLNGG